MTCIGFYSYKYGVLAGLFALQLRGKLEAVGRYYTVIMVSSKDKGSRIASTFFYIVYRGVAFEVLEHLFAIVGSTIVISPTST